MFIIIVYAGYSVFRRFRRVSACKIWLLITSLFFYAWGSLSYLPLLVATALFNYAASLLLSRHVARSFIRKLVLAVAICENIGFLLYFKYADFFLENINRAFGTQFLLQSPILPLGISFFTFQLIIYISGIYKGKAKTGSLLDFGVFVTFFPKLIIGPLMQYEDIQPSLQDGSLVRFDPDNIIKGLVYFSIGCAKKVLIAQPLIYFAQGFYDTVFTDGHFFGAWFGVLAYTLAYYFDFSGYIDMAMGLARLFNIKLPENFDSPYKAKNFADYWRRWNITITRFFNDFIFKNIYKFGNRLGKLVFATMVTFLVSGIWHGAGWNFIFWGLLNGVFVSITNIMTLRRKKLPAFPAWLITFLMVLLTRVLFDSGSISKSMHIYRTMFDIRPLFVDAASFLSTGFEFVKDNIWVLALVLLSSLICFFGKNSDEIVKGYKSKWYHAALCGSFLCVSLFFMGGVSDFFYFQF